MLRIWTSTVNGSEWKRNVLCLCFSHQLHGAVEPRGPCQVEMPHFLAPASCMISYDWNDFQPPPRSRSRHPIHLFVWMEPWTSIHPDPVGRVIKNLWLNIATNARTFKCCLASHFLHSSTSFHLEFVDHDYERHLDRVAVPCRVEGGSKTAEHAFTDWQTYCYS